MIVWISSYPKSGNTWVRSLLSAYLFSQDGIFNFDLLNNIKQFSSKNFTPNKEVNANYQSRISENWIPSQRIINNDNKIHFLKTHNAICTINGNRFTDRFNTAAAIYVVRDPRNLITSLSHHFEISIEEAFNFLTNKKKIIFPKKILENNENDIQPDDFNFIGDWSGHYQSWKNINFCAIKIIRYEDILLDDLKVFNSILIFLSKFIKIKIEKNKVKNALKTTSFKSLSNMEEKKGFNESVTSPKTKKKIKFFNLGQKNNWKELLDSKNIKKIENAFKNEMIDLNYL